MRRSFGLSAPAHSPEWRGGGKQSQSCTMPTQSGLHENSDRALGPRSHVGAGGGIRGSDKEPRWQPGGAMEGVPVEKGTEHPGARAPSPSRDNALRTHPSFHFSHLFHWKSSLSTPASHRHVAANNPQQAFYHCSVLWRHSANIQVSTSCFLHLGTTRYLFWQENI